MTSLDPAETTIDLSKNELVAMWAALVALVEDFRAPQDQLTVEQFASASDLLARITPMLPEDQRS